MGMANDVARFPAVVTFTRNAPIKMAGHARYPSKSNAASAIPAGGHTGDALACNDASINPNLPAMKYTSVKIPMTGSPEKARDCLFGWGTGSGTRRRVGAHPFS